MNTDFSGSTDTMRSGVIQYKGWASTTYRRWFSGAPAVVSGLPTPGGADAILWTPSHMPSSFDGPGLGLSFGWPTVGPHDYRLTPLNWYSHAAAAWTYDIALAGEHWQGTIFRGETVVHDQMGRDVSGHRIDSQEVSLIRVGSQATLRLSAPNNVYVLIEFVQPDDLFWFSAEETLATRGPIIDWTTMAGWAQSVPAGVATDLMWDGIEVQAISLNDAAVPPISGTIETASFLPMFRTA